MSDVSQTYSDNALWDLFYNDNPHADPISAFSNNAVVSNVSPTAPTASQDYSLQNVLQKILPQNQQKQVDWFRVAVYSGLFVLIMLALGSYIVKPGGTS